MECGEQNVCPCHLVTHVELVTGRENSFNQSENRTQALNQSEVSKVMYEN